MKPELIAAIQNTIRDMYDITLDIELSRPEEKFGDYATNVALQLAGRLGQNPRAIADVIADRLRTTLPDTIASIEVAGPGFLNLTLTDGALVQAAAIKSAPTLVGQTILCEYSDPNPFKPLHAGHLYTTLVGDTISRLFERAGANVTRINYGGDVGLHVGKSMWSILRYIGGEYPEKLAEVAESDRPSWLGDRYVEGNTAYEDDEQARTEIVTTNRRVYELQASGDHESAFAEIYWTCRQWSYEYFARLYEQLEVKAFDRYLPESEVTQLGVDTVRQQLNNGVYSMGDPQVEGGPKPVVFQPAEDSGLHTRVFINSAGIPTYETKDVGLILTKWREYHFDSSIVITANEQSQYMKVMLASVKAYEPEPVERTHHLTHGIVKLQGGVKMSSRKGNTVSALDILTAARAAGAATGNNPSEQTILAAIKYAFARVRIGGDIAYDPQESIALEGNSGPYLQYAHARARSIIAKATSSDSSIEISSMAFQPAERSLLRKLGEYSEVIERSTSELLPHHICTYLYELAQTFNVFYEHNRVIGDERQDIRLWLITVYADTLRDGLELLGITAPDRM